MKPIASDDDQYLISDMIRYCKELIRLKRLNESCLRGKEKMLSRYKPCKVVYNVFRSPTGLDYHSYRFRDSKKEFL